MTDLKFTSPSGETTIKVQDTGRLGTVAPKTQLHIRKMTDKELIEIEIAYFQEQIKVKQKKLKELEQTKSPVEEAYKDWWGEYPETGTTASNTDDARWLGFQAGYHLAYEEKVSETAQERGERVHNEMEETIKIHDGYGVVDYKPTPQTPEQVADGLKEAFREAVKQGVVSSNKPKTLTDIIYRWWEDVFTTHSDWDMKTSIEDLVDQIELFLPKEQSAEGSQNAYVESAVEGFNDAIKQIKSKLR